MAEAEVVMSHHLREYVPGQRVTLDEDEARRLIDAGFARPATKPEAEKLGVDPEDAATVAAKKEK